MRLLYASSIRYPSPLANRIQTLSTSRAFSKILKNNFFLGAINIKLVEESGMQIINFNCSSKSYYLAWKYVRFIKNENITHVLCREERLLFFLIFYSKVFSQRKMVFIYEAHFVPDKNDIFYFTAVQRSDLVVGISHLLKKDLVSNGIDHSKIIVCPDAVDQKLFTPSSNKKELRESLGLPQKKTLAVYTGSFFRHSWKGIDIVLESAKILAKEQAIHFVLIGGQKNEIKSIAQKYPLPNLTVLPHISHNEIPRYLNAGDILLLPNKKGTRISERYTSPMKLFEYIAIGKPIVASDLLSIREILNEKNAVLVQPNNAKELVAGITQLVENKIFRHKISKEMKKLVKKYTWERRAESILKELKKVS